MLDKSSRFVRAMLDAHERNVARARPEEAVTAGFVWLSLEARRERLAAWATLARDEPPAPAHRAGAQRVPPERIHAFLNAQGFRQGTPRGR